MVALLFWLGLIEQPTLRIDSSPAQLVIVQASMPILAACTVYSSLDESIEQGDEIVQYEPRHCWLMPDPDSLDATSRYVDGWDFIESGHTYDVHAELQFLDPADPDGFITVRTKTVRVER
jgi:hypothetical protein